jgi:hypothetical protein
MERSGTRERSTEQVQHPVPSRLRRQYHASQAAPPITTGGRLLSRRRRCSRVRSRAQRRVGVTLVAGVAVAAEATVEGQRTVVHKRENWCCWFLGVFRVRYNRGYGCPVSQLELQSGVMKFMKV